MKARLSEMKLTTWTISYCFAPCCFHQACSMNSFCCKKKIKNGTKKRSILRYTIKISYSLIAYHLILFIRRGPRMLQQAVACKLVSVSDDGWLLLLLDSFFIIVNWCWYCCCWVWVCWCWFGCWLWSLKKSTWASLNGCFNIGGTGMSIGVPP